MHPLRPGEWGIEEVEPDPYQNTKEKKEYVPKPETSENLVSIYRFIADTLQLQPSTVYYPCCNTDVSPSSAFPKSRVVYVDLDQKVMEVLQESSYEAYLGSALEFQVPGQADLLILLNPQINPDVVSKQVKIGGHVICNNFHDTAFEMKKMKEFEPMAVVLRMGRQEPVMDTDHPRDYLTHVKDDAEFQRVDPETFAVGQKVRGEVQSVLEGYMNLVKGGTLYWGCVITDSGTYKPLPTLREAKCG